MTYLIPFVLLVFCVMSSAAAEGGAIRTKAAAAEIALQYTGFAEAMVGGRLSLEDDVSLVSLQDSTTPFLSLFTDGRAVWRVDFKSVRMVNSGNPEKDVELQRDFEVYIDSASGNFVKAVCYYRELDPHDDVVLPAWEAETQLRSGGEVYGVPEGPPTAPLIDALLACPYDPFSAKQITVQYVIRSYLGHPRPVWVILLQGIPPVTMHPPGFSADWVPVYMLNRIWQIVDAVSGKILFSTTIPGIRLRDEDERRLMGDEYEKPKSPDSTMDSSAEASTALASPEEAVVAAIRYAGIGKELSISKSLADSMVRTTVMHDDNIPFLSDSIEGKSAWVVTFRNVILERGADERAKSQPQVVMDFEVYLDQETGRLFKIVSPYVGGDSLWMPLPSGKELTSWIWGNETYHGFPDIPPKVPFMDAYLSAAGCSPFGAEEVIAHYVLHSRETDSAPRPVWCITTRGVPYPIILGDSRSREDERTSLRCVVDATSGQWLFVENYR